MRAYSVKDHNNLLRCSPLLKKACVRQVCSIRQGESVAGRSPSSDQEQYAALLLLLPLLPLLLELLVLEQAALDKWSPPKVLHEVLVGGLAVLLGRHGVVLVVCLFHYFEVVVSFVYLFVFVCDCYVVTVCISLCANVCMATSSIVLGILFYCLVCL